jgi:hypothetical protein
MFFDCVPNFGCKHIILVFAKKWGISGVTQWVIFRIWFQIQNTGNGFMDDLLGALFHWKGMTFRVLVGYRTLEKEKL